MRFTPAVNVATLAPSVLKQLGLALIFLRDGLMAFHPMLRSRLEAGAGVPVFSSVGGFQWLAQ